MGNKDKLKEINIENCRGYYFDDMIKFEDFDLDILIDKKIFWFTAFHTKLWLVLNLCGLGSIIIIYYCCYYYFYFILNEQRDFLSHVCKNRLFMPQLI